MTCLHEKVLAATPMLEVLDMHCSAHRSGWSAQESAQRHRLVLARRGVFAWQTRAETYVAEAGCLLNLEADEPYRFAHPADGGDDCMLIAVAPETWDAVVSSRLLRQCAQLCAAFSMTDRSFTARRAGRTMKQQRILAGSMVALSACLGACATLISNPGIVEVAPDQYMLAARDPGGSIGNTAALKARVIKQANDFATAKGKRAIPVPLNQLPAWPSCDPLLVEYHFRLVDPTPSTVSAPSTAPSPSNQGRGPALDIIHCRGC